MRVVVPYRVADPKTRLAPLLDREERVSFSETMLADVLDAVTATGHAPTVLATEDVDPSVPGTNVRVDDRPLSDAVNALLGDGPVAVVMADLALATTPALSRLFDADGDVVIAPGVGGGTNALVVRHPDFRVDYHGVSYRDHRRVCERIGAATTTLDSYRLGTDVDEPGDLAEVLLHGEGRSRSWLRDRGVRLAVGEGRVGVRREDDGREWAVEESGVGGADASAERDHDPE
ncbi:2-phospho-L-lactate guanylyltransferase [Halomarina ordinaria]|uniref:2-phospho-L-lactate guanylyltransferase n=1 Tax=Halomarina ordinaria TaxID=3033939 RepID=A0ABD5UDR7_9EURY|nr:2-phospho-L-lactate guanylyltransferase [Halomarina sp. PSRA2]